MIINCFLGFLIGRFDQRQRISDLCPSNSLCRMKKSLQTAINPVSTCGMIFVQSDRPGFLYQEPAGILCLVLWVERRYNNSKWLTSARWYHEWYLRIRPRYRGRSGPMRGWSDSDCRRKQRRNSVLLKDNHKWPWGGAFAQIKCCGKLRFFYKWNLFTLRFRSIKLI